MLWHLCNPTGVSERTTEADDGFWARRRFVPIPKGWFVCSDASYKLWWNKLGVPDAICEKCFRYPAIYPGKKCTLCKGHRDRSTAGRKGYEGMSEAAKEKRSARLKRVMSFAKSRHKGSEKVRQSNIRRAIELRKAGRTAAARQERNNERRRNLRARQLTFSIGA